MNLISLFCSAYITVQLSHKHDCFGQKITVALDENLKVKEKAVLLVILKLE